MRGDAYAPGTRVFAIQDADDAGVRAFGFGTYDGMHVPPGTSTVLTPELREIVRATQEKLGGATDPDEIDRIATEILDDINHNPRITLDSGGIVWGYQCWWGPADTLDDLALWLKGRPVEYVKVPE